MNWSYWEGDGSLFQLGNEELQHLEMISFIGEQEETESQLY